MTPDEQLQIRDRAAGIEWSRRAAIVCVIGALVCFAASLYFWDNAFRELDISALTPT